MKVIFHYAAGQELARRLAALRSRGLDISVIAPADDAAFAAALPDCDVLWHVLKPATAAVMAAAPRLRLIQKMGAGVDTIDLAAARQRGISVCNLPGTNSQAVAEHALALMLAVLRKVPQFDQETRAGKGWAWPQERQAQLGEIHGRTVGLAGYGATASRLAPVLLALGAEVIAWSRSEPAGSPVRFVSFDELVERSDIVSLHLPLNDTTRNLFDADRLARMKRGAVLINTARGGLVEPQALVAALQSGQLAGAGLDTFAAEPVEPDNPLLRLDNVVVAPHVAWLTLDTFARSFDLMAENCRRLVAGEQLMFKVA